MRPLRIVLVMRQPPLPFGGAAARWLYVLLRGLVARGHRVTAFAACGPPGGDPTRQLFSNPPYDLRVFPQPTRTGWLRKVEAARRPHSYVFSPELLRDLSRVLGEGFDLLHLEELWAGWLGLNVADRAILSVHNLWEIDLAAQRSAAPVRYLMTKRAERRLLRHYPNVVTLTPRLTDCIRRVNPLARVRTIPLGLALDQYVFTPPEDHQHPTVGLIGTYSWAPTLSAAERLLDHLWPAIQTRVPHARLQLVGRRAKAMLAGRCLGQNVSVEEDVSDIIPYFRRLDVLLYVPKNATGMKVKVLEAMALGVPVVTNAEGAEGLPVEDGTHVGLAEDDGGLVDRAVALLESQERRQRQAGRARALVTTHCSGEAALDATEQNYRTVLAALPGTPR